MGAGKINPTAEWPEGTIVLYTGSATKGKVLDARRVGAAGVEVFVSWQDVPLQQANWVDTKYLTIAERPSGMALTHLAHTPVYWS